MLLHLPIVVLTTFSPVAVADSAPTFDIVRECRFEGGSAANVDQCASDEAQALGQLKAEWTQFAGADKSSCTMQTTIGGFASYVDLLTCLEMARDTRGAAEAQNAPGRVANQAAAESATIQSKSKLP
jgi:hypothetical protein